jgi:Na+-translocating ferredoxin:NAD+ oxidoreductase RnfC subunit
MKELKNIMREFGIVGAGGAGFPSYAKLAEGADLLLVNGSECEPLLYTDYVILKDEMPMVLSGIYRSPYSSERSRPIAKTAMTPIPTH